MEPEINQAEGHLVPLKKVTPLSKYLAVALFVVLPFLGGWIGYTYAPERIAEQIVYLESSSLDTKDDFRIYPKPDAIFYPKDLPDEIEVILNGNQLKWEADYKYELTDSAGSYTKTEVRTATITKPSMLRYVGLGYFSDGIDMYSLEQRVVLVGGIDTNIPETVSFDPTSALEVMVKQEKTFVVNGDLVFMVVHAPLSAVSGLFRLPDFNLEKLVTLDGGYITDDSSVYITFDTGNVEATFEKLDGVHPDAFFVDDDGFGVSGEAVYSQGVLLEGIAYSSMTQPKLGVITGADTVYLWKGTCHYGGYQKGTLDEIETYRPPC